MGNPVGEPVETPRSEIESSKPPTPARSFQLRDERPWSWDDVDRAGSFGYMAPDLMKPVSDRYHSDEDDSAPQRPSNHMIQLMDEIPWSCEDLGRKESAKIAVQRTKQPTSTKR
jgi:hypothetical protein